MNDTNEMMIILSLLVFVVSQIIFIVIVNYLIDKNIRLIMKMFEAIDNKIGIENPKEPKLIVTDTDLVVYRCPNCNRLINRFDKHCFRCGQRFNDNWYDKYEKGDAVAHVCEED